ncbi:iron dicitrate transporter FecR [Neptunitalea chrysea]|uniref:Iron dicitrate transporter FecR n=1 Tax=Neptunitalea chrysea TaxID=1647581 RepID=A0A9W6B529_9FLAO|nr:FecR domain-containing protein [Neptunitalea chrysea]GLB52022.1 iron dicitrate transporter FecR [Neptunitalea chrysea]
MKIKNYRKLFELYESNNLSQKEQQVVETFFSEMQHNGMHPDEIDLALERKLFTAIKKSVKRKQKERGVVWRSMAAALLVLIGVSLFYVYKWNTVADVAYITVTASENVTKRIVLPDSTIVYLNKESSLSYPEKFMNKTREVKLEGEGYFRVKHNAEKPFLVVSANMVTKVLGTQFVVSDNSQDMEPSVKVLKGKVKVNSNTKKAEAILTKNQQVFLNKETGILTKKSLLKDTVDTFWSSHKIRFKNADMSTVIAKLNEYFKVHIVLKTPEYDGCKKISGSFKSDEVESVLKGIQFLNDMEYKRVAENEIHIYLKSCENDDEVRLRIE